MGCGAEMVPVLGKIREWHFRHKSEGKVNCQSETYLHKLAKRTVVEGFAAAKGEGRPYYLVLPQEQICRRWEERFGIVCQQGYGKINHNLTKYFDVVQDEVRVDGFISDVLFSLIIGNDKFLLEISVTHCCEEEKKCSGLKIVEVHIGEEGDVLNLWNFIDGTADNSMFYGLKKQRPIELNCAPQCESSVVAFHVFRSGKCLLQSDHPREVAKTIVRSSTIYSKVLEAGEGYFVSRLWAPRTVINEARFARDQGVDVKICYFCRYHGIGRFEKAIFCKFKRLEVGYNEAANCDIYLIDYKSTERILNGLP